MSMRTGLGVDWAQKSAAQAKPDWFVKNSGLSQANPKNFCLKKSWAVKISALRIFENKHNFFL